LDADLAALKAERLAAKSPAPPYIPKELASGAPAQAVEEAKA